MQIKPLDITNFSAACEIENSSFVHDAWGQNSIKYEIEKGNAHGLFCESGKLQCFAIINFNLDICHILSIATSPQSRKKGYGTAMLKYIIALCKSLEIEKIELEVRESNTTARSFYEKSGFIIDGYEKNGYTTPKERSVLMSYFLKNT